MSANSDQVVSAPLGNVQAETLAERLERGEIVTYAVCPFLLPEGEDRQFLFEQRLGGRLHKNISYDPCRETASGFRYRNRKQAERLRDLLGDFSRVASRWLAGVLPRYAASWQLDRVSYRPEEEATRRLRLTARNDLLHIDAFPSRPSNGQRILRLFTNINLTEPRVWITSDSFPKLLQKYGMEVGLPSRGGFDWARGLQRGLLEVFQPGRAKRSVYDDFMIRFHDFLKTNDDFQEQCFKRYWSFPPGSAWLVMTDSVCHAALRGCYALEHSVFIAPETLTLPDESPAALLARAAGMSVLNPAA